MYTISALIKFSSFEKIKKQRGNLDLDFPKGGNLYICFSLLHLSLFLKLNNMLRVIRTACILAVALLSWISFAETYLEPNNEFTDLYWVDGEATIMAHLQDQKGRIELFDYEDRGDVYRLYDSGRFLGEVSNNERGAFDLQRGDRRITVKVKSPFKDGKAIIRLVSSKDQFKDTPWDEDSPSIDDLFVKYGQPVDIHHTITRTRTAWVDAPTTGNFFLPC